MTPKCDGQPVLAITGHTFHDLGDALIVVRNVHVKPGSWITAKIVLECLRSDIWETVRLELRH